jgi:hypothetical protein
MTSQSLLLFSATALAFLGIAPAKTPAAVLSGYPYVVVTNSAGASPGNLIGTLGGGGSDGTRTYYVILDNTGTNILYASTTNVLWRFVTPQGFATDQGVSGIRFKNERLEIVDAFTTLGYGLDTHDVKLLPNGHALLLGAESRVVDLSQIGGRVDARVTGSIIQEIDADKRLVFEWHSLDHIAVTNSFINLTGSVLDYTHVNSVTIDPTDNNLLTSFRHTAEIVKINRATGQVMWRLGGKMNQFTFINEREENAPFYTLGQHDVHRLANGNLLYFDNGNLSGSGASFPMPRNYSRVVEYALDEVHKTATLVWEYRHVPDIQANCQGAVKRMANGNTLIDWGCASGLMAGTIVTEVNPAGEVVFEMTRRTTNGVSPTGMRSSLTKQLWNSPELLRSTIHQNIQQGQTYDSPQAGVSVTVNQLAGPSNNAVVVQRYLDAVRFPRFAGKAPQVLMEHVVLAVSNAVISEAVLNLNLPDTSYVFDTPMIHDPAEVIVYQRATPGQGEFSPLPTTFDAGTRKLHITTTQLGEFIFAYPDVAETPHVPLILTPPDQSEQSPPVTLAWSAQGFVDSFDLQVATDAGFSDLIFDTSGLGTSSLILQDLVPDTQYFWRVRTINQGGASGWASASFVAVAPVLQLTYPAGGEVWQRLQVVTIRWIDNLSENVGLDLFKGGVSNRTFVASIASGGSYTWTIGQFATIPPGADYTIRIRSTTNPALFDFSEPFSIVQPVTLTTVPAGLSLTVDGTNYTAPATFAWVPDSPHIIGTASPQHSADGHTRYSFESWSDGGAQSHSITAPLTGATNTARFSTNYLLDITVTPPGAAIVEAEPPGRWYVPGELVSLTAQPSANYLIYAWEGVDTQASDMAQVVMDAYRAVEAKFIPRNSAPTVRIDTMATLPDGRVQFTFTAGAGLATQATVWGTTTLTPPEWEVLATVPLTKGHGVFTDSPAPPMATRFYQVTLP